MWASGGKGIRTVKEMVGLKPQIHWPTMQGDYYEYTGYKNLPMKESDKVLGKSLPSPLKRLDNHPRYAILICRG
uniref:Uncharacterized protein n=1 Tax=viral metagenome TaxID=1070528 RepID=A0A6M3LWU8_9ZZZZ